MIEGSILTDWEIEEALEKGDISITPYSKELLNPTSLDIRLGNSFGVIKRSGGCEQVDPKNPLSFRTESRILGDGFFQILKPHGFIIACTLEHISLGPTISAKCMGKSSLGRLGLENSSMAGWVDPGFSGILTLELYNYSENNIRLTPGMKIGQLVFFRHKEAREPYNKKATSKYKDQSAGQGSKGIE